MSGESGDDSTFAANIWKIQDDISQIQETIKKPAILKQMNLLNSLRRHQKECKQELLEKIELAQEHHHSVQLKRDGFLHSLNQLEKEMQGGANWEQAGLVRYKTFDTSHEQEDMASNQDRMNINEVVR